MIPSSEINPLGDEEKLEFYGQRAWRPGKLSAEPADMAREAIAIQALQYREKSTVKHSVSYWNISVLPENISIIFRRNK